MQDDRPDNFEPSPGKWNEGRHEGNCDIQENIITYDGQPGSAGQPGQADVSSASPSDVSLFAVPSPSIGLFLYVVIGLLFVSTKPACKAKPTTNTHNNTQHLITNTTNKPIC